MPSGKSYIRLTASGSVVRHAPPSQYRPGEVISRMLISGLKLVANGWPWSPALQSMMSSSSIVSKWCFARYAVNTLVAPGSNPLPRSAMIPRSRKRSWYAHCQLYSNFAVSRGS